MQDSSDQNQCPHAFIHVLPQKTGDKFEREIVPAERVKNFDYEQYKVSSKEFKNVPFKIKPKEGKKKLVCFVLYAADTYDEVQKYVQTKSRFPVPNLNKINLSNSTLDDSKDGNDEDPSYVPDNDDDGAEDDDDDTTVEEMANLKRSKQSQKKLKKTKKDLAKETGRSILDNYLNANPFEKSTSTMSEIMSGSPELPSSSPKSSKSNSENESQSALLGSKGCDHEAVIRALKEQVGFYQKKFQLADTEAHKWKAKYEELSKKRPQDDNHHEKQQEHGWDYYDTRFLAASKEDQQYPEKTNMTHIKNGVYCNTRAYRDACKVRKPSLFVTKLSYGIYGVEDLATRYVRKQTDAKGTQALIQENTDAIETELYKYLKINMYPLHLMKQEMQQLHLYLHNAITSARAKITRQQKKDKLNDPNPIDKNNEKQSAIGNEHDKNDNEISE